MLFLNLLLFYFSQRFADVVAVTLSSQFSTPTIILLCVKILAWLVLCNVFKVIKDCNESKNQRRSSAIGNR